MLSNTYLSIRIHSTHAKRAFVSNTARDWVQKLNAQSIPPKLFNARYDRSSGPGGQNVNKVNSKCTLTMNNVSNCNWLPHDVRKQLKEKNFRYYTEASDCIVIQSDQGRSRAKNKEDCIKKFINEIKSVCYFPAETGKETLLKWERIRGRANEKRLQEKKLQSIRKSTRNNTKFDL